MAKFTQMAANEDDDGAGRRRIHLREINGADDIPLETVGQDLRAARLRRGDDLAAVSRTLKIRKDHLDALESDRLDDLPGRTYAIGFIRSYARYLGLDSEAMLERFKAEISGRHEEAHATPVAPLHHDEGRRLPQGWWAVAALVVVALIYGGYHIFSGGESGQTVPPPPSLTEQQPRPEPPRPMANAPQAAPVQPLAAAAQTPAPSPAAQSTPPAASQPAAPPAGASGAEEAAVPAVAPTSDTIFGQQNSNARVVLHARAAVRLTVRGDDGKLYLNRDLKPGQSYRVPDLPGLYLATDNAGAVDVDLDGAGLGKVGQPQQILGRVSLDPQSLADRMSGRPESR